jgi:hypothetical protein
MVHTLGYLFPMTEHKTRRLPLGETLYVYSVSHQRNLGVEFVAHIGVREMGGVNHLPICGARGNGPTSCQAVKPVDKKICPRCLGRWRSSLGEAPPATF